MTPRQKQLLDFIKAQIERTGCSPTYQAMAAHLRLSSKSGPAMLIDRLVEQGHLVRRRESAHGLSLPDQFAGVPTESLKAELRRRGELA